MAKTTPIKEHVLTCPKCDTEVTRAYWAGGPVEQKGRRYFIKCRECGFEYESVKEAMK